MIIIVIIIIIIIIIINIIIIISIFLISSIKLNEYFNLLVQYIRQRMTVTEIIPPDEKLLKCYLLRLVVFQPKFPL